MKITLHPGFKKAYKKRVMQNANLRSRVAERIDMFKSDPTNQQLKDHKLEGSRKGYRAFSITGDVRIVYRKVSEDEVELIDIGTHNQVY